MNHQRQKIRAAVRTMLLGNTTVAASVFSNRPLQIQDYDLPAIFIYSMGEQTERSNVSNRDLKRTLNLAIEARIKATATLDDELDAMALEIETVMGADETLNETAAYSTLVSTEMDVSAEGVRPIGAIRLTYEIKYLF